MDCLGQIDAHALHPQQLFLSVILIIFQRIIAMFEDFVFTFQKLQMQFFILTQSSMKGKTEITINDMVFNNSVFHLV